MSRTDEGAVSGESVFETRADVTTSREERFQNAIDRMIYTPVSVLLSDWRTAIGLSIIGVYVLTGTIGVVLISRPTLMETEPYLAPFSTLEYPLGSNGLGQPLTKLIVHATPAMLKMIFAGAVFSTTLATVVGTVAGYKAGRVDSVLMTISDIMLAIPGLPLIIVIAVIYEPESPILVGLVLTINAWAGLARTVRSQVLALREEAYVEASRVLGVSTTHIIRRDILPNMMPYILISFANSARYVIFASVGLYFLGILPFTTVNWGVILNLAYQKGALFQLRTAHLVLIPLVVIVLLSLGFVLTAQGADRLFNPRTRARHASDGDGGDVAASVE